MLTDTTELERKLAAQAKTIDVLMARVEDRLAASGSSYAALAENAALQHVVARKTRELEQAVAELREAQSKLLHTQKLEAIGQLAAGIAHEINTPTQYVSDNLTFLRGAFGALTEILGGFRAAAEGTAGLDEARKAATRRKLDYLLQQVPRALEQSLEGLDRVTSIVGAMKDFSHPGYGEKHEEDVHDAITTTLTVARNEWKYVADVVTEFDPTLPPVPFLRNEMNQVILNLIINAAHAISDATGGGERGKGTITIATRRDGDWAELRFADTGTGIRPEIRGRIFEPFFTTKPVGKGTGQGLAIAWSVIVDKHQGSIRFESAEGVGTTFIVRLPLSARLQGRPV